MFAVSSPAHEALGDGPGPGALLDASLGLAARRFGDAKGVSCRRQRKDRVEHGFGVVTPGLLVTGLADAKVEAIKTFAAHLLQYAMQQDVAGAGPGDFGFHVESIEHEMQVSTMAPGAEDRDDALVKCQRMKLDCGMAVFQIDATRSLNERARLRLFKSAAYVHFAKAREFKLKKRVEHARSLKRCARREVL